MEIFIFQVRKLWTLLTLTDETLSTFWIPNQRTFFISARTFFYVYKLAMLKLWEIQEAFCDQSLSDTIKNRKWDMSAIMVYQNYDIEQIFILNTNRLMCKWYVWYFYLHIWWRSQCYKWFNEVTFFYIFTNILLYYNLNLILLHKFAYFFHML